MDSKKRIAVNTLAQYAKTIISGIITLYSSRVILKSLGVDDFGIYSLIAGIIMMLSFLTNALSSTTQRYISYYQGKGIQREVSMYFCNSIFIHIFLGLILSLIFLAITPILTHYLNIPQGRMDAAIQVYYAVILTLFFALVTSPFRAVLISHENIIYISIMDVVDVILKLLIALSLSTIGFDKLLYYGWMLMLIQVFNFVVFSIYSFLKYCECIIPKIKYIELSKIKELLMFAGWNVYSLGCTLGRTQGISVALNIFVGTVANAAYGLGIQLSSYVNYMSESLLNAMRPQIMKAEGNNERGRMLLLSGRASKYSFFLLSLVSIPCIFEMPMLLHLWLGEYPDYGILFARMFMLAGIVDSLSIGLHVANQATGNLKQFSLIINTMKFATLPFAVISLYLSKNVWIVALLYIVIELFAAMMRIKVLSKDGLNISTYIRSVLIRCFVPFVIYSLICYLIISFNDGIHVLIAMFTIIPILYLFLIYYLGLETSERESLKQMCFSVFRNVKN